MKTIKFLSALIICLMFIPTKGEAQTSGNKIEVLNFHSTHRCMTCKAIEANTLYTLKTFFAEEMKNGIIVQKTINVDKEENEKIAEKFEASGTSLFLNVISGGKETKIDLSNFAFKKGKNKDAYSKELKEEIEAQLLVIEQK